MEIIKVKDWLQQTHAQFEEIETRPLSSGILYKGKDYYIEKVRRLKDDMIIGRGRIPKYNSGYLYDSKPVNCVHISLFDYDLIHVYVEVLFEQDLTAKIYIRKPNARLKIEINNLYESIESSVHKLKEPKLKR